MRGPLLCGGLLVAVSMGCWQGPSNHANVHGIADSAPDAQPIIRAASYLDLSKQCPLGEGTPLSDVRGWLERQDYAALDAEISRAHGAYRQTSACEHFISNTFEFLVSLDFAQLDRWVAARPDSWAALTARANKWINLGYERRGWAFAKDVTEEQWAGMRDAFARATSDLDRAVKLEPDGFMAYGEAIRLLQASGGELEWRPWLDALLARDPANDHVRRVAMDALTPQWGGSLAATRAVAEEAQKFAERNPRLPALLGHADAHEANALLSQGRDAEAASLFRRALARADLTTAYEGLATCLQRAKDWQALLELSDQWVAALNQVGAHLWRGRALMQLDRPAEALAAYEIAVQFAPRYALALELRGAAYRRLGRFEAAAADFRAALALQYNAWTVNQLAEVASEDPRTAPKSADLARALVAAYPTDHEAWFLLGSALHESGASDSNGALERYVELAQSEGSEWARLARARRLLRPPPAGAGTLPALVHVGLAQKKP